MRFLNLCPPTTNYSHKLQNFNDSTLRHTQGKLIHYSVFQILDSLFLILDSRFNPDRFAVDEGVGGFLVGRG